MGHKEMQADRRLYAAIIERGETGYGAFFPDLPGCASAGDTITETIANAHEALALHIAGMYEDKESVPFPTPVASLGPQPPEINVEAVVLIGVTVPSGRTATADITLDESLWREIDAVSADRSQFLANAARAELARRLAG